MAKKRNYFYITMVKRCLERYKTSILYVVRINVCLLFQVNIGLKKPGSKLEHQGIKIEFIGQIEMYYDRGNHHEFISLVKELARPGDMIAHTSYPFEFSCVEKPFEVYTGGYISKSNNLVF